MNIGKNEGDAPPVTVECFGMPGVGKTFMAERLIPDLSDSGRRVNDWVIRINGSPRALRVARKFALVTPFVLRRPVRTGSIVSFVRASRPSTWAGFARVLFNWLYVMAVAEHGIRRNQDVVLDQGIAQALWSTLYYGRGLSYDSASRWINELVPSAGFPQLVVLHVQAAPDQIREQVRQRRNGGSPLDRQPETVWERACEITDQVAAVMAGVARRSANIRIVEVQRDSAEDKLVLRARVIEAMRVES